MPGGAEALVHIRETIEGTIRSDPSCGAWATVDVDFQNAFLTLRYKAIDAAVSSRIKIAAGLFSCHLARNKARRGAEQGDPLASMQCGCVIADITAAAIADMKSQKPLGDDLACFGFWYADDGQYVCRPGDADLFLNCFDHAAATADVSRGTGQ